MKKFNTGRPQVHYMFKAKSEIRNQQQNCSKSLIKRKLKKVGNEDINEIAWEG
jgi:hypothetical protein